MVQQNQQHILPNNMLMGSIESLSDNGIILGYWLAAHLGTSIGDKVNITFTKVIQCIIKINIYNFSPVLF